MANAPSPGDIESLARQYWDTLGGMLGMASSPAGPWAPTGGWPPAAMAEPAAFDWYARMQQLAAQFAEGGSTADISAAWRSLLGGQGGNVFAGVLHGMPGGPGAVGGWPEQVRPFVEVLLRPLRQQSAEWLGRPGLGPGREHQQRLQALAMAWQEWEQRSEAFNALLSRIGQDAFVRFERLLQQHESPEKRLATARALFDLWIDAAEEAWAEAALSEDYQQHYAALTNALMRVRQGLQEEVERMGALLGLPGRTELDAVHRKVTELERSVHALRRAAGLDRASASATGDRSASARRKASPARTTDAGMAAKRGATASIDVSAAKADKPARAAKAATRTNKVAKAAKVAKATKATKGTKATKTTKTTKATPVRGQSATGRTAAVGSRARPASGTAAKRRGRGR